MQSPYFEEESPWHALANVAARAGVSIEHLCTTVEAATQVARDSVLAHKARIDLPYPTYDDDLEAVVRGLWDDDFEWELKQAPWVESEHPRDERGRFTSGSSGAQASANISQNEIIQPAPYRPPTNSLTAEEAREELIKQGKRLADFREPLRVKVIRAKKLLVTLNGQRNSTSDPFQQAELDKQRKLVAQQIKSGQKRLEEMEREHTAKLRELLYVVDPTPINVRFDVRPNYQTIVVPITAQHQRDAAHTGAEEVRRMVSAKVAIGDMYFERENMPKLRSKYTGNRRVKLTDDAGTRIVVHELGHGIERLNPAIKQKAIAFRDARTQGEPLTSLRDDNENYDANELTRRDRFIDPYMGKIYDRDSDTEIITMGLEYFFSDPVRLATEDQEYFDFIYDTLRGK